MNTDIDLLKMTLKLAKQGMGWTNPNPLVGAVIVKNGRIIGKGFHHKAGLAHAEIDALNKVTENPTGATLYVNLEPCIHSGKTPPCTDPIIKAGIKRVVCSTIDPNPKVNGQGIKKLQEAGIAISIGLLKNEARKLNEVFFTFHEKKRPFVAIKFAASLDGKIATRTGDSKWITNEKARNYARSLRIKYQAVLVGINTILADNPNLGAKVKNKKDPIRIILDPQLQIPLNAEVLRDANVIIATTKQAPLHKKQQMQNKGFTILDFKSRQIQINKLLSILKEQGVISLLIEGGGETLGSFIDSRIIDKVYIFHAPMLLGGKNAISIKGKGIETIQKAIRLKNISFRKFDDNLLTTGYVS